MEQPSYFELMQWAEEEAKELEFELESHLPC